MIIRKIFLLILILILTSGISFAKKAADFTFKDLSGKDVSLADFKGKVIILNFWATWCGPCIYEMPDLEKLYQKYHQEGLQVIGLTLQSPKKQVPQKIAQAGVTYPILLDAEEAVESYGPFSSIPQTYIIDRQGEIVAEIIGMQSYSQFEKKIKKYL